MTEDKTIKILIASQLSERKFEQTPGDSVGQRSLQSMGSQRVRPDLATEQQGNIWFTDFLCHFIPIHFIGFLLVPHEGEQNIYPKHTSLA